jgi:hypothetical protein
VAFISGGLIMLGAIACIIVIPVIVAIVTLGLLIADDCITLDEIKEFIMWLDERADDRKKNRQGRSKFYDKNSRY